MPTYRSLEDFSQFKAELDNLKARRLDRYRKILQTHYDQLPTSFQFHPEELTGVEWITVVKPQVKRADSAESFKSLNLKVAYHSKGSDRLHYLDVGLLSDGTVPGALPPEFPVAKDDLVSAVVEAADRAGVEKHYGIDGEILSQVDVAEFLPEEVAGTTERLPTVDMRRLQVLNSHDDLLFWFSSKQQGLDGYVGHTFRWGVVLENPHIGNAMYVIPFEQPLPPEQTEKLRQTRTGRDEFVGTYKDFWESTKQEARNKGAVRFVHPDTRNSVDEFEKFFQQKIVERFTHQPTAVQLEVV